MGSRTRSSYLPLNIATRGLTSTQPLSGQARAVSGYLGGEEIEAALGSPAPLLSTQRYDTAGTQRLLSNNIQALDYWNVHEDVFANPDKEYTGFAADGFWYENGQLDLLHVPARASWADEVGGTAVRGVRDAFPARIITVATPREVAIFDADTLDLWLRFLVGTVEPPARGALAGKPTTELRAVRFVNGALFIATSEGLRIADFRSDFGMILHEAGTAMSSTTTTSFDGPLALRNEEDFLDGASFPGTAPLQSDDCLCLGAQIVSGGRELFGTGDTVNSRRVLTVAVVGHENGLTAVTLGTVPATPSLPKTLKSPCKLTYATGWEAHDDYDLDTITPFLADDAYGATNWRSQGVQAGDVLTTDAPSEHVVSSVDQVIPGRVLTLAPELGIGQSGTDYRIERQVTAVLLTRDLDLYVANGAGAVAVNRTKDWFTVAPAVLGTPLFANAVFRGDVSELTPVPSRVNGLTRRGDQLLIASDLGVYSVSEESLRATRAATLLYTTAAQTTYAAEYQILEGVDTNVTAVAVDPETGSILVAVTDTESVVTEINPDIQQAFRFHDDVGRVNALVTFRNPLGPPDNTEVT